MSANEKTSGNENSKVELALLSDESFVKDQKILHSNDLKNIGPVYGRFYVFDRDNAVQKAIGQITTIRTFLQENSGIKVFRDGIRVYNYGEPYNDWLSLDIKRVNRVGDHFSNNVVIGSIELDLETSHKGLKEKTNREGFDENPDFLKFRAICESVFVLFENTAQNDRELLRSYINDIRPVKKIGFAETITELKEKLKEKKLDKELEPILKRVEHDYVQMSEVMLNSGMAGLNLAVVFHEVDREMKFISSELNSNTNIEDIKFRIKSIIKLLDSFTPILKQNKNIIITAQKLAERAVDLHNARFRHHKIVYSSPLVSKDSIDFQIKGPGNLLLSALSNVIDNAIYWVTYQRELSLQSGSEYVPRIVITSNSTDFNGNAIVIADNGGGFNLEPEELLQPFKTTRPGGMGLGLYFVDMVMKIVGGAVVFPEKGDIDLPDGMNGAIIALVFKKDI